MKTILINRIYKKTYNRRSHILYVVSNNSVKSKSQSKEAIIIATLILILLSNLLNSIKINVNRITAGSNFNENIKKSKEGVQGFLECRQDMCDKYR